MGLTARIKVLKLLKKYEKKLGFQTDIKWEMVLLLGVLHISAVCWIYLYSFPAKWQTVLFALVMHVNSGLGIIVGVHRHWCHRSYKATLPLKIYLMLSFTSAGQMSIYEWCLLHRAHHKYSETEADPHNIKRGFFFAHIGWAMLEKTSENQKKESQLDMTDIEQDPVAAFERKYSILLRAIFCFLLPTVAGVLLWGETWQCAVAWQCYIRFLAVMHVENTVNSVLHSFGTRPYNPNILATQNIFISLLTLGEGGHNYHHMYPSDYRSAEPWDILNLATFMVKIWEKLGLAYDLKETGPGRSKIPQTDIDKFLDGSKSW